MRPAVRAVGEAPDVLLALPPTPAVILFDVATANDVLDALRLLDGRLRGSGRALSDGARELLSAAERSLRVSTGQPLSPSGDGTDDGAVLVLDLLTLDEVADRLRSSQSTVKRLVRDGRLPVVHLGRATRVRPSDLAAFIDGLGVKQAS